MRRIVWALVALFVASAITLRADDWPEYRGKGRTGVWNETGLLDKFPEKGLTVLWRTPLALGFSGPAIVNGRVYVLDFTAEKQGMLRGTERLLCLEEKTGRVVWTREWPADYGKAGAVFHAEGPAATPTVDGDRVYVLGRAGALVAVSATNGDVLWSKDYKRDYNASMDAWGSASPPIVEGNRLIALVGGKNGAALVAWDKLTGRELWRALTIEDSYVGTSPLIAITAGGVRQVIMWHTQALVSLDPATGKVWWQQPFRSYDGTNPAPPVYSAPYLMISNFTFGSMLMKLDDKKPDATMVWKGKGTSEIDTDGLHALVSPFQIKDGYVYGICAYGQLRCLRLATGERVWETQQATKERARYGTAFIVRNGDRYFINNDRGELVIARLTPQGYEEISRTQLIKPTTDPGNRRQLKLVHWSHPAYANKHIYVRNDEEIICASLAADGR